MQRDDVLSCLARITRRKPADLHGHLSLASLGISQSFGLSALRSQIEARSGRRLPVIDVNTRVETLLQWVAQGDSAADAPADAPAGAPVVASMAPVSTAPADGLAAVMRQVGLGMDLQEVAVMPDVADFQADPFYAGHFTPAEIATAVLRPAPRVHLCGLFCAKEAAKKTHPALLPLRMLDFEVRHEADGRPTLHLRGAVAARYPAAFLLSITHSGAFAAATCITYWTGA